METRLTFCVLVPYHHLSVFQLRSHLPFLDVVYLFAAWAPLPGVHTKLRMLRHRRRTLGPKFHVEPQWASTIIDCLEPNRFPQIYQQENDCLKVNSNLSAGDIILRILSNELGADESERFPIGTIYYIHILEILSNANRYKRLSTNKFGA